MLRELASGQVGHKAPVRLILSGPQGLLLTGDTDMQLCLWSNDELLNTWDCRHPDPRRRPHDRLRSAAFSSDGSMFFVASGCQFLAVDVSSGDTAWTYVGREAIPFILSAPLDVKADGGGTVVVAFDNGTFVRLREDGVPLYRRRDNDSPTWLAIDRDRGQIVGCDSYCVRTWDLETGKRLGRTRIGHHAFAFDYSPVTQMFAIRRRNCVAVAKLGDDGPATTLPTRVGPPLVGLSHDGGTLAYADGNAVAVHFPATGDSALIEGLPDRLVSLHVGPNGSLLWTGHGDGSVRSWDMSRFHRD